MDHGMKMARGIQPMELVKNKASGKFFVVLDDNGGPDFLVITPKGKVRRLERHLFDPQDITNSGEAIFKHQLTKTQVDLYAEYSGEWLRLLLLEIWGVFLWSKSANLDLGQTETF
jgi:hypothetical protein